MKRLLINLIKVQGIKFLDLQTGKIVENPDKSYIRDICYDRFMNIYNYFKDKFKYELIFTDMYRRQAEQMLIYKDRQLHPEKGRAGRPTLSPHLYGQAFDVAYKLFRGFSYKYFEIHAMSCGFNGINNELWHFQYMTEKGNNFMDEILSMVRPYLPLTIEEAKEHLRFAGYSDNNEGILNFQKDMGLVPDGIIGQQTQIRLLLYNTEYKFLENQVD